MRDSNWNDLRVLLAVERDQRLAAAARRLGIDDTTVSRRLAALQDAAGQRLYQRLPDGRLDLTEAGQSLAALAERLERDLGAFELSAGTESGTGAAGVVRLTSVPFLVNRVLAPAAEGLFARYPKLQLELIAEARDLSLTRREADMALRLARPKLGGLRVKARRVGRLAYAAFGPKGRGPRQAEKLPWITYEEASAHLPQARWMAAAIRKAPSGHAAPLRVNDVEAAHEAVAAGLGRSMLPRLSADRDPRLVPLAEAEMPAEASRELWLLVHGELQDLPRLKAVAQWIEESLPG